MSIALRVVLTILLSFFFKFAYVYTSNSMMVASGDASTAQFEDRDVSGALTQMHAMSYATNAVEGLTVLLFIAIWWGPVLRLWKSAQKDTGKALALGGLLGLLLAHPDPANAYYSTSDYAEWVNIGPNETAFLIPVEGANKSSQAQFDSADFLNLKKVPAKRIQIPHIKQANTGFTRDYYVPSAIVIKLDRSFVSRTFKGNDPNDPCGKGSQCFSFESQEGVTMHVGIAVTAWIPEERAAQYLYRHGVVKPKGNNADENTYTSVFQARPLSEVMETNIHNEIQALLSQEFGRYPFKDAVAKKVDIMNAVREGIKKQFGDAGIDITSIGFATPLVFPVAISTAINSVIASQHDAEALAATRTVMDVKAQQADIAVKYAVASAIEHDKLPKLPTFMVLPESVFKWFSDTFAGWFGSSDKTPAKK
jgi:hypothetical protein